MSLRIADLKFEFFDKIPRFCVSAIIIFSFVFKLDHVINYISVIWGKDNVKKLR